MEIINQETKNGATVIKFESGLRVRINDDGSVDIRDADKILDSEFRHIASVRYTMKNG